MIRGSGNGLFASPPAGAADAFPGGVLGRASYVLAFLSVAFLSLDIFPHSLPFLPHHPKPSYILSLAGLACWFVSMSWRPLWREHRGLLGLVGAYMLYGLIDAVVPAARAGGFPMAAVVLVNYLERQLVPLLYVVWFAFLLSPLPQQQARRFFVAALICLFIPTAAHMALEMIANAGAAGVRDFLVRLNPWFRLENVYHGVWPPAYYEDRVRGLFAEPAHMAYALMPVLAFFLYKTRTNLLYAPLAAFILFAFLGPLPTVTGILGGGFLLVAFCLDMLRARSRRFRFAAGVVAVCAVTVGAVYAAAPLRRQFDACAAGWRTVDLIADYCRKARTDPRTPPPPLGGAAFPRFSGRMLSFRLETDIALQHPFFGVGYYLSGLYRKPLEVWADRGEEPFLRVRSAMRGPFPVYPHLCEYTVVAAEMGFVGLGLFFALCFFVARRAWRCLRAADDAFVLYMLFAFGAFFCTMLSMALKSGYMFWYFLGFLYAVAGAEKTAGAAGKGTAQTPGEERAAHAPAGMPKFGPK